MSGTSSATITFSSAGIVRALIAFPRRARR
jgi:hypothetical protein